MHPGAHCELLLHEVSPTLSEEVSFSYCKCYVCEFKLCAYIYAYLHLCMRGKVIFWLAVSFFSHLAVYQGC